VVDVGGLGESVKFKLWRFCSQSAGRLLRCNVSLVFRRAVFLWFWLLERPAMTQSEYDFMRSRQRSFGKLQFPVIWRI